MPRTVTAATPPGAAALAELKTWLGISASAEDAALAALLGAAIDACEGFTGTRPLQAAFEETLCSGGGWQALSTGAVGAITGVAAIQADGSRFALASTAYAIDIDASGIGRVQIVDANGARRVVVAYTAGLAATWDAIPDGLRHGLIRFAAYQYRSREDDRAPPGPPAAVAALWQPWRRLRLA